MSTVRKKSEKNYKKSFAGYGKDDVSRELYNDLERLAAALADDYGEKEAEAAENIAWRAGNYTVEDPDSGKEAEDPDANFKKAVDGAKEYLNKKLPDDQTIGEYAKKKGLLSPAFDKLMERAGKIAELDLEKKKDSITGRGSPSGFPRPCFFRLPSTVLPVIF